MTFKSRMWYPIAVVLSVINVAGFGFAVGSAEPWHATIHAVLGLAFGFWASRSRRGSDASTHEARLEGLEAELSRLREQVSEAHERLDFAERVLVRGPESRRVSPPR